MPRKPKEDPIKRCKFCGKKMERKRINGRLEDRTIFLKRIYCDKKCMAKAFIKPIPTKTTVGKRYRHLRMKQCEICGSSRNLCLHHVDKNRKNNHTSNLMTLCNSCHTSWHHLQGDIIQKKKKPPCFVCGKPSYRLGMCCTHLTRYKKYGSPLLTKKQIGSSWHLCTEFFIPNGLTSQE